MSCLLLLKYLRKTVVSVVLARADKYADNGNSKGISFMFFVGNFIHFLAYSVPVFVAIYFGMDAVAGLTGSIPENIMNGITAVGNVLPAIGFAMLLNSLGDKKLFPFFFAVFPDCGVFAGSQCNRCSRNWCDYWFIIRIQ